MTSKPEKPGAAAAADPRWPAIVSRDSSADGTFFYSVRTTGAYCRPSCPSRMPRPHNVQFYETAAEAERAGFRPCKRCRPDQPSLAARHAAIIADLCRFIDAAEELPSLNDLSEHAQMSPSHLHRVFKDVAGMTPKAYAAARRAEKLRGRLSNGNTVTSAIYEAGYNSSSRFYEDSNEVLGMTPGDYRAGGAGAEIRFAVGECSLGSILVAQTERGVCAIFIGDDPDALVRNLQDRFPAARLVGGDPAFEQVVARVVGFVEAPGLGLDLPLDIRGTTFQQRVWRALQRIPPGQTVSYADLAQLLGAPKAARAVAGACAANLLAVAIPCHRVVRNDGGLSGYRWGVERKRALLEREKEQSNPRDDA